MFGCLKHAVLGQSKLSTAEPGDHQSCAKNDPPPGPEQHQEDAIAAPENEAGKVPLDPLP